ncbi:MAG: SpoIIE family protein phosphatase [Clostridiales bacterium]|jgi:sigma-B regulation protein RsbU (phosphoserine phosphatase)|nr:SpoIIE family protein phosphatase [Clostridiales bacterium]
MTGSALKDIDLIILAVVGSFAVMIVLTSMFVGWPSRRFAKSLVRPIMVLQDGVRLIANGNLEHVIDIRTGDEIEELGVSVNKMSLGLKSYIANLQSVTAEKERIGAELDVATKIQASMLPCIFPAFPERAEFDIFASMLPAKEVGGDFYDFFLIDGDTLAVVIADVSGKGVSAALFMVIAKTLIKNNAQYGKNPKEVFETVSNLLCENNEAWMFVTAFLGYLDIPSGRFTFVNAGYNPPLLRGGSTYSWLKAKAGFVLAGMEGLSYTMNEVMLNPGDCLFLYTDGVTEAADRENRLFGDARLLESVNKHSGLELKAFIAEIKNSIDIFAGGAEQADDITMLILRYKEAIT